MIPLEQLQLKVATLEQLMTARSPSYKGELEEIRQLLQRDPELVHLLHAKKELHVIFAGMQMYKQIEIPITVQKGEKSKIIPKNITTDSF